MCGSFPGLLIGRTAVHSGKDPAFVAYDQFLSTGILQPLSRGEVRLWVIRVDIAMSVLTSASLIGCQGQALSDYPPLQCRCRSRARASLRNRHQGPFHHGIRRRGGTIFWAAFWAALPSDERQVQADMRTHLIHRPARDIIPPLGGARVSFYWIRCCTVFMLLLWPVLGSSGTRCRQPICGA